MTLLCGVVPDFKSCLKVKQILQFTALEQPKLDLILNKLITQLDLILNKLITQLDLIRNKLITRLLIGLYKKIERIIQCISIIMEHYTFVKCIQTTILFISF